MSVERPTDSPPSHLRLLGWTVVCAVLWGSAFPAIKLVYAHWAERGVTIDFAARSMFAGLRFVVAGGVLLLVAQNPGREWRATPTRLILIMAATQTVGQYVCFYLGLELANGALSALLISSGSFWWVLLAPPFLGKPPLSRRQWLVVAAGAIGVTLAVYAPGGASKNPQLGAVMLLGASLFGALGLLTFQRVRPTMGSRAGTGFSLAIGGVVLIVMGAPAIARGDLAIFDAYTIAWTAWLSFVSAAAFGLWNQLSTMFPAHQLATYRFLIPVCGVFESLLLLKGEVLTPGMICGGLIVVAAITQTQNKSSPAIPPRV
ncbi:DMT family transporter [Synoicihabitans lomoniglobus]|uniref:DMT family transporter n=1 Tax=Synoicihabitans lomoniglobus TaxID=2909285 RepID=A0AAF0CSI3_9BACT|nr:DMT family transporter [Opitutaceae bacterium LMO-M01]WED67262.1 DMT family transporter [Opitutaceae bacterium LMO-M01]